MMCIVWPEFIYSFIYILIFQLSHGGFKPVFLLYLNSLDLNQACVSGFCFHASTMCLDIECVCVFDCVDVSGGGIV